MKTDEIYSKVEAAVREHLSDFEFDEEHFQRGTGFSVDAVINRIVGDIKLNFNELNDNKITQEVENKFEDTDWDNDIAYEYLYDLQRKLEEYAENHNWNEIPDVTADQTICEDIIQKTKYVDYSNDLESFLNDYFPKECQKSKNIDELVDSISNFQFAFFSFDADLSDPEQALEQLYTYNSIDDFIEDFEDVFIDNIEVVEDDFAEWLIDNNKDYLNMMPNDAIQKFMAEPDWELYMKYIKSEQQGFETVTWAVPWTDEFYYSKEDLIRALSY